MTKNMVAALRTLQVQMLMLYALRLVGPCTTKELLAHILSVSDGVSQSRLQRFLTMLRQREHVRTFPYKGAELMWALPGQEKPARRVAERRTVERSTPDRRHPGSWWIGTDRRAFSAAMEARWQ